MFTGRALVEYNNKMPYQVNVLMLVEPHIYLSQQQSKFTFYVRICRYAMVAFVRT